MDAAPQDSSSSDGDLRVPEFSRFATNTVLSEGKKDDLAVGSTTYPLANFRPAMSRNKKNKGYRHYSRLLEAPGSRLPKKAVQKFSVESLGKAATFKCCTQLCCEKFSVKTIRTLRSEYYVDITTEAERLAWVVNKMKMCNNKKKSKSALYCGRGTNLQVWFVYRPLRYLE